MPGLFDTADMRPLYFIPDITSPIVSDHASEGGVYFSLCPVQPEDLNIRVYCNMACRYLSRGFSWEDVLIKLGLNGEDLLKPHFEKYTGMSPELFALWSRK
jgi:hypothetical protein